MSREVASADAPPTAGLNWRFVAMLAGLISASVIVVYAPSLGGGFVYDDHFLVERNYEIRALHPAHILRALTHAVNETYRPLRVISYAIDYRLWGLEPLGFRLTNVGLHIVNGMLVFLIAFVLLRSRWAAAFAALLFTLHPIQTETVAWISGRKDALATAFALGSFWCYLRGRFSGASAAFQIASCILFMCALLAKEAFVSLIGLIFIYEALNRLPDPSRRLLNSINPTLPYLGIAIIFVAIYFWIGRGHGALETYHEGGPLGTLALMTKGFAYYVWLLFFPVHLCADYNTFGQSSGAAWTLLSAFALLGIAALAVRLILALRSAGRREVSSAQLIAVFGLLWFFLGLVPVSNIIPIAARIAERYLYFPSVGFCLAAAALMGSLYRLGVGKKVWSLLSAVFVILLAVLTAHRAAAWTSDRTLWETALFSYPNSARVHYSLGYLFHQRLSGCSPQERQSPCGATILLRASFHFQKALEADPKYAKALVGLGHVALDRGLRAEALRLLDRAAAIQPADALVRADYGSVLSRMGNQAAALQQYLAAASLAPRNPEILRDLGRVYLAVGQDDRALHLFSQVLALCPQMPAIYSDIGNAYLALGRFREAVKALEKALQESPGDPRISFNLSYAYEQLRHQK